MMRVRLIRLSYSRQPFALIVFVVFLMIGSGFFYGCAKNSGSGLDLERIAREQATTIESLNHEIGRLNEELDQAIISRETLREAQAELEQKLRSELASGDLSIGMDRRGLVVTLLDRVLFDSGRSELKTSAQTTLNKLAEVLQEKLYDHSLYVEGHTDNVPIRYSSWRSNWELSTARATEVIHYFSEQRNVNPERLAAVGYGEYHPVASNDSEDGRMLNRRVEIVISPLNAGGPA